MSTTKLRDDLHLAGMTKPVDRIVLTPEEWDHFMETIERPPAPTPELIELMQRKDRWADAEV